MNDIFIPIDFENIYGDKVEIKNKKIKKNTKPCPNCENSNKKLLKTSKVKATQCLKCGYKF